MDFDCVCKGSCCFRLGDNLRDITINIPSGYGVYIFHKNALDGDILYIGKAGTVRQNGIFQTQQLRERINNRQEKQLRQTFLNSMLQSDYTIHQIIIEWYIVNTRKFLPAFIEAQLLQNYYSLHQSLPLWNKEF